MPAQTPVASTGESTEAEGDPNSHGSENDYFSPNALFNSSIDASQSHNQFPRPPPYTRHDSRTFVEAARHELYGKSTDAGSHDRNEESPGNEASNNDSEPTPTSSSMRDRRKSFKAPQRAMTEYPTYPNQAHSALHYQFHPQRVFPRTSHAVSSSQPHLFAASSRSPRLFLNEKPTSARGVKTVGNTPAQTPGSLQAPQSAHEYLHEPGEESSPYPSPYLHPVQLQPPRTVTSADRQIDQISGRKMINQYQIIDELGRGVHGKVKLGRSTETGEQVAIKIVQRYSKKRRLGKQGTPEDKVKKEMAILKKVQHPNVVRLLEVIDDPEMTKVYIVLEFCELKEIVWRTLGLSDVVLMEYRRQDLEYRGYSEEATDFINEQIQKAAMKQHEKQARLRPQLNRRAKSEADNIHWSLEFAGDTDEEGLSSAPRLPGSFSTKPLHTNVTTPLDLAAYPDAKQQLPTRRSSSLSNIPPAPFADPSLGEPATPFSDLMIRKLRSGSRAYESSSTAGYSFYSTEWYDEPVDEAARERKRSLVESLSFQITDLVEHEVPDDYRFVPTMTISECRSAFRDALIGLDYLHYHGIIHRDIKPENLLRTRDHRVKISDFGVSYLGRPIRDGDESADLSGSEAVDFDEETELAKTVGTPAFYAPELCKLDFEDTLEVEADRDEHEHVDRNVESQTPAYRSKTEESRVPAVTGQIDVWALGVTLYCLLFARTPFTAENEFALMRRIAEENIFIPRRRLKAVDPQSNPLTSSDQPLFSQNKRGHAGWAHERIDDTLYDLLKKLFEKNPKKRLSIRQLKHHEWVVADISNPTLWREEVDPARLGQEKKIEISNQEIAEALNPLKIVQRIKSLTKRASSALGLGGRRKRGQSSVTSPETGGSLAAAEQQDSHVRRSSVQISESILSALKTPHHKEQDHPSSRYDNKSPVPPSEEVTPQTSQSPDPLFALPERQKHSAHRPPMADRQPSELSNAGSIRTVRPSDFTSRQSSLSPTAAEIFSGYQAPVQAPTPSTWSSLFGGAGRQFLKSMRSGDRLGSTSSASSTRASSPRHSDVHESHYGEPSVAVSTTSATGHVDFPHYVREKSATSSNNSSPSQSRRVSVSKHFGETRPTFTGPGSQRLPTPDSSERSGGLKLSPGHSRASPVQSALDDENGSTDHYRSVLDSFAKRRAQQENNDEESNSSGPSQWFNPTHYPPVESEMSPKTTRPSTRASSHESLTQSSPSSNPYSMQHTPSHSSDDRFTSEPSPSTSFPSLPSMVSATSSLFPSVSSSKFMSTKDSANSSEGTANASTRTPASPEPQPASTELSPSEEEEDDGYIGDGDNDAENACAVDSESSSDEEILTMGRRKSVQLQKSPTEQEESTIPGHGSRRKERRETALLHRRNSRSGSSSTTIRSESGEGDLKGDTGNAL